MGDNEVEKLFKRIDALEGILSSILIGNSHFVSFEGYGVRGTPFCIKADSVMTFHQIDYNGYYGTELKCYDGSILRTREWMHDVELKLKGPKYG